MGRTRSSDRPNVLVVAFLVVMSGLAQFSDAAQGPARIATGLALVGWIGMFVAFLTGWRGVPPKRARGRPAPPPVAPVYAPARVAIARSPSPPRRVATAGMMLVPIVQGRVLAKRD